MFRSKTLTVALVLVAGATLILGYFSNPVDPNDCTIHTVSPIPIVGWLLGVLTVIVLTYGTFVVAKPRPFGPSPWRYVIGVPIALGIAAAVGYAGPWISHQINPTC